MEIQKSSQQSSLAVRSKLKTALCQKFSRQKRPAPEAHPQDQEASQEKQQEYEAVATQFHLFPDLPVELRLTIWAEATRYKRYVILNPPFNSPVACFRLLRRLDRYRAPGYVGERRPAWTSRTPPPPLLSVSKEAREVALKTWQLAFSINDVPPGVYINFDQDDVVIGAGARVNKVGRDLCTRLVRPSLSILTYLIGVWLVTPDVEKIQRVVACGNFMRGIHGTGPWPEFMKGLESLTVIRIGRLKWSFSSEYSGVTYVTSSGSRKGAPLLSFGGIDFVKTTSAPMWTNRSFATIEVMDFVGGSPWAEIQSSWTLGPQALGWGPVEDDLSTQGPQGPRRHCVRRANWNCYTVFQTIRYAI